MKAFQHRPLNTSNEIIGSYTDYIIGKTNQGWDAHLLTFLFNQIRGPRQSVHRQMERELERVYAIMLTRIVRNPRSEGKIGSLPIWIGCPDYPVPKWEKQSLRDVAVNDGLHVHAIALIPPKTRLRQDLRAHVQAHHGLYAPSGRRLQRIDVQLIETRPDYVTGYVFKALARGRVDFDHIVILPRTRSETDGYGASGEAAW
jgi:hypothetical protein